MLLPLGARNRDICYRVPGVVDADKQKQHGVAAPMTKSAGSGSLEKIMAAIKIAVQATSGRMTHHLSVRIWPGFDSSDDEIEHAVGSIRIGRMFIHQGDTVDESYHVENMDICSDLSCGLSAEQED